MRRTWSRIVVAGVLAAAGVGLAGPGAVAGAQEVPEDAPTGAEVVAACDPARAVSEIGVRACGSARATTWLAAQHCRRIPPAEQPACPSIDGRPVHEAAMADFEAGWAARALDLQRDLDLDVPLHESLTLHTHNSGNSAAYDPSLTINDANQVVSVTDQLRLGIRGIELDLHWWFHPTGTEATGGRAVVQCHGQSATSPAGSVHPGCSVDRLLTDHLAEIRTWIDEGHADGELVLLYLENQLDQDPTAHALAVEALEAHLGDLLVRPTPGAGCQSLPMDATKRELLDRVPGDAPAVLVTGNCGPGGWTDLVFDRSERWTESGSDAAHTDGDDCDAVRTDDRYEGNFVRRWEDTTFLSLMANGGSSVTVAEAAGMVRCGVNLPGLDQVHPGDERLAAFVWSWRPGDRGEDPARACAAFGTDARIGGRACATALPVACTTTDGWLVVDTPTHWAGTDDACTAAGAEGAGAPATGWEAELLRRAVVAAGLDGDVWLGYARDAAGTWVVTGPGPGDDGPDPEDPPVDGPGRPDGAGRPDEPGRPDAPGRPGASAIDAPVAAEGRPVAASVGGTTALLVGSLLLLVLASGAAGNPRAARRRR